MVEKIGIRPQSGPQTMFATCEADICIYGGSAGGGKTWALLLEPARHAPRLPGFASVYFRRTTPQITNPGGLLDASYKVYPLIGGKYNAQAHEWRWPSGGKVKLAHMQHDSTRFDWQGSEIPLINFDELTHFTAEQFWYMVSRNRTMCGIRPYIRATCNPDADSWVAELIAWWIDEETGLPIPERAGVVRYVVRVDDKLLWGDTPEELAQYLPTREQLPDGVEPPTPKSLTFIPSTLFDNRALMKANPDYLANLLSLPLVERERLLSGNWKIRPAAGLYFKRTWVEVVDATPPVESMDVVRYWDLAATEKTQMNDPDWTVGTKLGRCRETGVYYVLDVLRERIGPFGVEQMLKNTATQDGKNCRIGWGKDPGQAGKAQTQYLARRLEGFTVMPEAETGDKTTRFGPFSSQARAGNIKVLRARWNEEWFRTLEGFPDLAHDDDVDSASGSFEMLNTQGKGWAIFEVYRREAEELAKKKAAERAEAQAGPLIPYAKGSVEYDRAMAEIAAADAAARETTAVEANARESSAPAKASGLQETAAQSKAITLPEPLQAEALAFASEAPKVDKPAEISASVAPEGTAETDAKYADPIPALPPIGSVEWMMQLNGGRR